MAQAEGPCARWKAWAKLSGSAFRMKLTSPWRHKRHCLAAVAGDGGEAEAAEQRFEAGHVGAGELDELEAVGAHRVRASEMMPAKAVRSGGMSMARGAHGPRSRR